jgi:hypothetical protein
MCGANTASFVRMTRRKKFIPMTFSRPGRNRSVEKGMASSAVHPAESTRAAHSHTPFQLDSQSAPSSENCASTRAPSGFVENQ